MQRLSCAEIWGGIKDTELDVCSSGLTVSLYSSSADGGKGGDIYCFSVCGADRVTRLLLADVMGHGSRVSEVSQWIYEEMAARLDDPDLPAMLSELNGRLEDRGFRNITTATVLSYYVDLKDLYFCSAGHFPVLARGVGDGWQELTLPASDGLADLPLGVSADTRYQMSNSVFANGARLLVFSDGVIEAPNTAGDMFGEERLRATLADARDAEPAQLRAQILDALRAWTGGPLDHDDVTLIAMELH